MQLKMYWKKLFEDQLDKFKSNLVCIDDHITFINLLLKVNLNIKLTNCGSTHLESMLGLKSLEKFFFVNADSGTLKIWHNNSKKNTQKRKKKNNKRGLIVY